MEVTRRKAGTDLSQAVGRRPVPPLASCADALSLPRAHLLFCDMDVTPELPLGAVMCPTWTNTQKAPRKLRTVQTPAPERCQVPVQVREGDRLVETQASLADGTHTGRQA